MNGFSIRTLLRLLTTGYVTVSDAGPLAKLATCSKAGGRRSKAANERNRVRWQAYQRALWGFGSRDPRSRVV